MKTLKYIIIAIVAIIAAVLVYSYFAPAKEVTARIDIATKLVNAKKPVPVFEVYMDDSETPQEAADWMLKYNNQGNVVQKTGNDVNIKINALKDASIKVNLKGPWKQDDDGNQLESWVKYTSVTVDGQEILTEPVNVWHNEPFTYTIDAKAGNTYNIHAEWKKGSK